MEVELSWAIITTGFSIWRWKNLYVGLNNKKNKIEKKILLIVNKKYNNLLLLILFSL